jgi:hypothetical protein
MFCIGFCALAGQMRRKQVPGTFGLLVVQAWVTLVTESLGVASSSLPAYSNHILFNVYMPIDFLLMLYAGQKEMGQKLKQFNLFSIIIYFLVWGGSLLVKGLFVMANFAIICGAIILTIRYFLVLLWNSRQLGGPLTTGIYLIAISVVLYYCCVIPNFSLMYYFLKHDEELAMRVYLINDVLSCLRYLFTGFGLLMISGAFRTNTAANG